METFRPIKSEPTKQNPTALYTAMAFGEMGIEGYSHLICPETGLTSEASKVLGEELTSQLRGVIDQSTIVGFSAQIIDELYFLGQAVESKLKALPPDFIPEGTFHAQEINSMPVEQLVVPELEQEAAQINREIYGEIEPAINMSNNTGKKTDYTDQDQRISLSSEQKKSHGEPWSSTKGKRERGPGTYSKRNEVRHTIRESHLFGSISFLR